MRRWISFFLLLVLLTISLPVTFAAALPHVVDEANLLTSHELQSLSQQAETIGDRYQVDVVILTVVSLEGKDPESYADDYYDQRGYGLGSDRSGILLLISTESRDWAISTCGQAITWVTDQDLERLEKVCTGMVRESSAYRVLEADYFKHAGPRELAMALGAGYDDILIDFGVLEEGDTAEFLRCEKQFVVASFSEWQQENLREFAMERERTEKESWQYLAVFGSDETRKEFWRRFGILSRRIPFSADAFSVTEECGIFFEKLV